MSLYPTISQEIHKGESQLLEITLLQSDNSPLLFASLQTGTKVEFWQNRCLIKALLLADDEIREGDDANAVEVEIKASVSALFAQGYPVFVRVHLVAENADYSASSDLQTDIKTFKINNVL